MLQELYFHMASSGIRQWNSLLWSSMTLLCFPSITAPCSWPARNASFGGHLPQEGAQRAQRRQENGKDGDLNGALEMPQTSNHEQPISIHESSDLSWHTIDDQKYSICLNSETWMQDYPLVLTIWNILDLDVSSMMLFGASAEVMWSHPFVWSKPERCWWSCMRWQLYNESPAFLFRSIHELESHL